MSLQRTNIFKSTLEGKKQKCPKCKKEIKVIGIRLIQLKKAGYEVTLLKRCSYDCEKSLDQEFVLKEKKEPKVRDGHLIEESEPSEEVLRKHDEEEEQTIGDKLEEALEEMNAADLPNIDKEAKAPIVTEYPPLEESEERDKEIHAMDKQIMMDLGLETEEEKVSFKDEYVAVPLEEEKEFIDKPVNEAEITRPKSGYIMAGEERSAITGEATESFFIEDKEEDKKKKPSKPIALNLKPKKE